MSGYEYTPDHRAVNFDGTPRQFTLVERLRECSRIGRQASWELTDEAADAIEQLDFKLKFMMNQAGDLALELGRVRHKLDVANAVTRLTNLRSHSPPASDTAA